jgi:hypothetical protein
VCMCGFFNVWVCVFVGVLVICVLVFTVFCTVCTVFLYCFVHVYLFLFVSPVLVHGLLPPSENSIAVVVIIIIIISQDAHSKSCSCHVKRPLLLSRLNQISVRLDESELHCPLSSCITVRSVGLWLFYADKGHRPEGFNRHCTVHSAQGPSDSASYSEV